VIAALLGIAACSDDERSTATTDTTAADTSSGQNACPVEGCAISITEVTAADGDELLITWSANFTPDFSKNHIHVFWDTYTADQVTDDAAARNQTQGEWVPTGDYPEFVTEGAVSKSVRGSSTTVCVSAADRDHNVIDSTIVDCRDVSTLL
jgi:hypothetical protein